jgi:hypothetical protein
MNVQYFAGLLGFLFAAAWYAFGFGEALVCLIVAGLFYAVARFMQGDLDVDEVRERVEGARAGFSRPQRTGVSSPPQSRSRA